MKTGLILEGGAMRGMFTAGVLDVLMEQGITVDGMVGVSAGAVFGCNYKSHQIGRTIRYNTTYCNDKRYASFRNLLRTGNLYSEDFCYHEVPEKLDPFDDKAFRESPMDYFVVCTDVRTGDPIYHKCRTGDAEDIQWMLDAVPNKHNGLTFCAGSFSAGEHNDCVAMAKQVADRTHFVHLRSCFIFPNGNFTEASHLGGRGHLIDLCRIFEKAEQEGKCNSGRRLPMRVDHGMTFTDEPGGVFDESNHGHNAGYTLLGRMFAMGQIQGVIATVDDELGIEYKQPGFYD